jgi:hypothetical protein
VVKIGAFEPGAFRSISRATMWRMISEVPFRIRMARTSRQMRSIGTSLR